MKLLTILSSLLCFVGVLAANPNQQPSLSEGSIAHVCFIKPEKKAELDAELKKITAPAGMNDFQFHQVEYSGKNVLLATYEGKVDAWDSKEAQEALKPLAAFLEPHTRLGEKAEQPWVACESVCQLRPRTPAPLAKKPTWHAAITGLKPEKEADYRNLHNMVWPGVIDAIGGSAIPQFDLYIIEFDEKPTLFYLFKYTGADFDADMKKMAGNPVNKRWWSFTDPCQQPLPAAKEKGEIWTTIERIGAEPK